MLSTPAGEAAAILVLNGGSSSVKFACFSAMDPLSRLLHGTVDRIGQPGTVLHAVGGDGAPVVHSLGATGFLQAGEGILDWLQGRLGAGKIAAIGHRIVHGGAASHNHQRITPELLTALDKAVQFDPAHLPAEIALIRACERRFPGVPQVACFDTVFHQGLPRIATLLPIPRRLDRHGVRRYGFHGLSYEYLMTELERIGGPREANGRVVLCHLGSGASMAAVAGGKPVDTTMGFTPASGLMMGTRCGDIDPGVLVHLARSEGMDGAAMDRFINAECGLLGVSETSADMGELLRRRSTDVHAAEAVELFCRTARKSIGALAAVLGGIDTLVFTGGIGEHSPAIRTEVCQGLRFLGIEIDPGRNADGGRSGAISPDGLKGGAAVRVIPTDEERVIVRHVRRLLASPRSVR